MEPKDIPSRSLENSSRKSYADYGGPSQEVSEDSNSSLARHPCSCDLEAEEKQKQKQKNRLLSAHVLRICLKLSLTVMN